MQQALTGRRPIEAVAFACLALGPAVLEGSDSRAGAEAACELRSSVTGVASLRSAACASSGYLSTASKIRWSDVTWSQTRESEMRESELRESARRDSKSTSSAWRGSEVRESEPRWSDTRESAPHWSQMRSDATGSTWSFADAPSVSGVRSGMSRPAAPETLDTSAWEQGHAATGDILTSLPPVYATIRLGEQVYYSFDGLYYREVAREDGTIAYEVVPPPAGATVGRLPAGCSAPAPQSGYWKCPEDVYYRETTAGFVVVENPE